MRKVFITGVGFITSIGNDAASVSESLRELRHGMVQYPPFQKPDVPVKVAAPILDFQTDTTDAEDWVFPARYSIRREIRFEPSVDHCLVGDCAKIVRRGLVRHATCLPGFNGKSTFESVACGLIGNSRSFATLRVHCMPLLRAEATDQQNP